MRFVCPLIAVRDISVSRNFYEKVLNQKVTLDLGGNLTFEEKFAIQADFSGLININQDEVLYKSKSFELYFEENDFDDFIKRLKSFEEIEYVHDAREYPWGQRVIRFYDPDKHIVEVGESMESVIKLFLNQGLSVEETSQRTMHPIEFVKQFV